MKQISLYIGSLLVCAAAQAQEPHLVQSVSMQGSLSHGKTPLWLNANKYGLSALSEANGYLAYEADAWRNLDNEEHWTLSGGAKIVAPVGYRYAGYEVHPTLFTNLFNYITT